MNTLVSALALAAAITAAPALAADGITLINQDKVQNGGITNGDAAGFPVTLSEPGSYRLSSDIVVPDVYTTAFEITGSDITLDLNGFTIRGPVHCTLPSPSLCSPLGGSGNGIRLSGGARMVNVALTNGTVRGMGGAGIVGNANTPRGLLIDRVRVVENGSHGMSVSMALVQNSLALNNAGSGFFIMHSLVQNSGSFHNGNYGIFGDQWSGYSTTLLDNNDHGYTNGSFVRQLGGNLCSQGVCP